MNELKIFENAEFGSIRTTVIDNEPWFVGKDVAEALGVRKRESSCECSGKSRRPGR